MAGVLVNSGEGRMLNLLVNKAGMSLENLVLRLYKNDVTPAETNTAGTYTEADFTGYSAVTLVSADWTVTEGAPGNASCAQKTFTSSANQSAQNVYGYYATTASGGVLVLAERFTSAPFVIENNGDAIRVTPAVTLD